MPDEPIGRAVHMPLNAGPAQHARWSWATRPNLVAACVVLLATLLRYHTFLSIDGSIVQHDWYTLHQVDAMQLELAAREGLPIPFWSPWILGGTPLFAVPTKAFSYPPFVLAALGLGANLAMNVLLLVHVFIGGFGTVLLARRLGLQGIAPIVCGAFFVTTRFPSFGFLSTPSSFGWAVAWWPYTLIALLDLLEGPRRARAGVLLGVLAAAQWHAGGEPSLYWITCFSAAFALPWLVQRRPVAELRALLLAGLLAVVVFLGLAAVKLLPELSWLESSGRSEGLGVEFTRDSILEQHALETGRGRLASFGELLWRAYAGGGALVLAACVVLGAISGARRRVWLALLAGTLFCYLLASGAAHEWAYDWLPGYDRMRRHTRFAHVIGFGAILLAGFGLQLRIPQQATRVERALQVSLACALGVLILLDTRSLPGMDPHAPSVTSATERRALTREYFAPVLADAHRPRLHHEENKEQPTWIDLGIEATSGALGGPRSGNARYTELIPERATAATLETSARGARGVLDVLDVGYVGSYTELDFPHLELVGNPADLSPDQLERLKAAPVPPFYLYRRRTARARACLVDGATLVVGESERCRQWVAEQVNAPGFDARAHVLVELPSVPPENLRAEDAAGFSAVRFVGLDARDPAVVRWSQQLPGEILPSGSDGSALWTRGPVNPAARIEPLDARRFTKSMESIEVDVSGTSAPFLLLAEVLTLHPGWEASVDGAPAPMLRADALATLVRLPAGARRVAFRYRAPGFVLGAWISGITLLCLVGAALAARNRASRT